MTTKLTILDEGRLMEGGLTWNALAELAELSVHHWTAPEEIVTRAAGSRILLTNKTPLNRETLRALPGLELVSVLATGYNVVDVEAARDLGILVSNVPAYGTETVAQHTWALILELCHRVGNHARANANGAWSDSKSWTHWSHPMLEVAGRRLGVVGRGAIAQRVASIGQAFGMEVVMASPSIPGGSDTLMTMEQLASTSDIVTLHGRLTPESTGLVSEEFLKKMKPTAFLVNTARGGLVDETALARALRGGWIAGAALDVLCAEPPSPAQPLLGLENCLVTAHMAWSGIEARRRLVETTVLNVSTFLAGHPIHVVNR